MEGFNQDQRQLCQSDCLNRGVHPTAVRLFRALGRAAICRSPYSLVT